MAVSGAFELVRLGLHTWLKVVCVRVQRSQIAHHKFRTPAIVHSSGSFGPGVKSGLLRAGLRLMTGTG